MPNELLSMWTYFYFFVNKYACVKFQVTASPFSTRVSICPLKHKPPPGRCVNLSIFFFGYMLRRGLLSNVFHKYRPMEFKYSGLTFWAFPVVIHTTTQKPSQKCPEKCTKAFCLEFLTIWSFFLGISRSYTYI